MGIFRLTTITNTKNKNLFPSPGFVFKGIFLTFPISRKTRHIATNKHISIMTNTGDTEKEFGRGEYKPPGYSVQVFSMHTEQHGQLPRLWRRIAKKQNLWRVVNYLNYLIVEMPQAFQQWTELNMVEINWRIRKQFGKAPSSPLSKLPNTMNGAAQRFTITYTPEQGIVERGLYVISTCMWIDHINTTWQLQHTCRRARAELSYSEWPASQPWDKVLKWVVNSHWTVY